MPTTRHVLAAVVLATGVMLPAAPDAAHGAGSALPEMVVVHDTRTSPALVDISEVRLYASWYWDSEQAVLVKVPHGFRPGHRVTVYFDLDGDSTPDGHYDLRLREPRRPGGKQLQRTEEFRVGGGWSFGGRKVSCADSEGYSPAARDLRIGDRRLGLALDLWWCLREPKPAGSDSGAWRAAVRVAKGDEADMAPNGNRWSKPVAGWGPCDPSAGDCPG